MAIWWNCRKKRKSYYCNTIVLTLTTTTKNLQATTKTLTPQECPLPQKKSLINDGNNIGEFANNTAAVATQAPWLMVNPHVDAVVKSNIIFMAEDSFNPPKEPLTTTSGTTDPGTNLLNHVPTQTDDLLVKGYGNHLHLNDGTRLDAGVKDNAVWQECYRQLLLYHSIQWNLPKEMLASFSSLNAPLRYIV